MKVPKANHAHRIPRSDITFPFTPNRMADSTLQDLISKLAMLFKISDEPGVKSQRTKKSDGGEATEGVAAWKEGGIIKTEWLKRERQVDPDSSSGIVLC
jgi:hypothetical protein